MTHSKLPALAAVSLTVACATPAASDAASSSVPAAESSSGCRALGDGRYKANAPSCDGLFVRGTLTGGVFTPASDVEGKGTIGANAGHPGWLELSSGEFFGQETARAPTAPYVEGSMTTTGFVPSSRSVVR